MGAKDMKITAFDGTFRHKTCLHASQRPFSGGPCRQSPALYSGDSPVNNWIH